ERVERETEDTSAQEAGIAVERQMQPAVRNPVGKEEDVARLLLHDAVEALDQRAGEDARVCRQAEEPEGEEGVEALPVPHAQKAPLRVARAHALAAGDGNAEVREHALQERSEERRVGKEGRCRGTGGQGR